MTTTIQLIQHLLPAAEAIITGEPKTEAEYNQQVQWLDARPQPTWAELVAAIPEFQRSEHNKTQEYARQRDYRNQADPLFFGWQRGENTEQEWLDKVAEIRARYPYS
jgi:hypothetical protein